MTSPNFEFLDYQFNPDNYTATFRYRGPDSTVFTEKVEFATPLAPSLTTSETASGNSPDAHTASNFAAPIPDDANPATPTSPSPDSTAPTYNPATLDQALFLAFVLLGTSYYKAHPTPEVTLARPLDPWQTHFFNQVYQEGLSQFAYENNLSREDLAHFHPTTPDTPTPSSNPSSTPVQENTSISQLYHTHSKKSTPNVPNTSSTPSVINTLPAAPNTPSTHSQNPLSTPNHPTILSLQSGGKDSLLTATLLAQHHLPYTPWYLTNSSAHPAILDQLPLAEPPTQASPENPTSTPVQTPKTEHLAHEKPEQTHPPQPAKTEHPSPQITEHSKPTHPTSQIARRHLDLPALQRAGGLNGHVPVTYIVQSLALIQAILNGQTYVLTSIGQEGNEPHAHIGDLAVNHQWSKTWPAEQLFAEYIHRYITPANPTPEKPTQTTPESPTLANTPEKSASTTTTATTPTTPIIHLGSPLRAHTELSIAEQFVQNCWPAYGHAFSSCNEANYRQHHQNSTLRWCGNCAKCANAYLLFAPFLPPAELQSLFSHEDLFTKPSLTHFFKGLLGVGNVIKPFECVGEIPELRRAYHLRQPGYASLPFPVPASDFDFHALHPMQPAIHHLFNPPENREFLNS